MSLYQSQRWNETQENEMSKRLKRASSFLLLLLNRRVSSAQAKGLLQSADNEQLDALQEIATNLLSRVCNTAGFETT